MFTIAPPPDASIAGIWNFMPRKVPRTLVAMPRSNSAGSMSASGAGNGPAVALLNAASSLPNAVDRRLDQLAARVNVSHVGPDGQRPAPARLDALDDGFQRRHVTGAEDDGGTGGGERLGGGRPDAPARARDQGDPALERQISHGRLLLSCLPHPLPKS